MRISVFDLTFEYAEKRIIFFRTHFLCVEEETNIQGGTIPKTRHETKDT